MKVLNLVNSIGAALLLGAAVLFGAGPSAQAQLPVTSGLVLRMDASQITGTSSGAQLGTWTDASGLGNNAVRQSRSSAGYPMYVTGVLNGNPVVRFNSGNANTGDYFKFTRITTIRSVFWVLKENAGLGDSHYLLGDDSSYQFHRASNNGPLWESGYADNNIRTGTTKLMGSVINGTTTSLPSGSFQLISLVTAGNVQANQICQDRVYHGSWQGDIAEILIYNRALTGAEELQVGGYLAAKYGLTTAYPAATPPATPTGAAATPVSSGAVSVSWAAVSGATSYNVSYKTTVGGAEQVVTGVSASPCTVSGLTNGTSYDFKVSATNTAGMSAYSAIVSATPVVSTAKDILTFVFRCLPEAIISGTNISVTVPVATDITALAPTYTVTAEDSSSQNYTATVTKGAVPSIFTWTTAGAGNWSDSSKWTNDLANGTGLVASGLDYYTLNFNQAGTYTTTQNLNTGFILNKLNFGGTVTLAGSSLALKVGHQANQSVEIEPLRRL